MDGGTERGARCRAREADDSSFDSIFAPNEPTVNWRSRRWARNVMLLEDSRSKRMTPGPPRSAGADRQCP